MFLGKFKYNGYIGLITCVEIVSLFADFEDEKYFLKISYGEDFFHIPFKNLEICNTAFNTIWEQITKYGYVNLDMISPLTGEMKYVY